MQAVVLVILVTFVFLGSLRSTVIPAVAIPVSLIATFSVLLLLDMSINTVTLPSRSRAPHTPTSYITFGVRLIYRFDMIPQAVTTDRAVSVTPLASPFGVCASAIALVSVTVGVAYSRNL